MKVNHYIKEKVLEIELTEEIDHHNSEKIRTRVDYEIQRFSPKKIIIDLSKVKFMDSAGIGLIIGRYKTALSYGGTLEVRNVSEKLKKILEMSGIHKIINIKTVA